MNRFELLQSWLDRDQLGLEIGPLHAPVAPKRDGWRVETLDHADAATLRARYADSPHVDLTRIEEVDHISDGRRLAEVIPHPGRYGWILASHVAEHVPDLLSFLQDCQTLLQPGGRLVLALPDKRYCFDALRPLSRTGEILQAHREKRIRHSAVQGFDAIGLSVKFGEVNSWDTGQSCPPGPLGLQFPLAQASLLFTIMSDTEQYHDLHGWVFVPPSMRLIAEELREIGVCGLREEAFHDTLGMEFFIVLSSTGQGPGVSRDQLVLDAAQAEMAGLNAMFAPPPQPEPEPEPEPEPVPSPAEVELAARTAELAAAQANLHAVRAEIAALRGSHSWRATAPLRWCIDLVRPR